MGPPAIVLLCGMQGHGKTEVARWLDRAHGFYRVSFADPLRAAVRAMGLPDSAFTREQKDLPCDALGGATPRDALESLGEWGRAWSPTFWADALVRRVRSAGDPPQVVIDDARFDVETAHVIAWARESARAVAVIHVDRVGVAAGTAHSSNRLPVVPAGVVMDHVVNDGDVATLVAQVDDVLRTRGCL